MHVILMLLLGIIIFPSYAAEDFDRQQLLLRIQPIGRVHVEGQSETTKPASAAPIVEKARTGQELYEKYCIVCHQDGIAGAPKFRNEADWKPRLASLKIEGLIATAIKGINAMPAKGTCVECTEADIKNALQYMLPKS
jgi:cytochrome c5